MALAELAGRRIIEMAREGLRPSRILTAAAFDNAIRADMAIGGSTNAIIHLVAIAGRAGVTLPLTRFDELSRATPLLVNVKPSGKYLMEDFFYAGGLPAVLRELLPLLHRDALTVNGKTLGENVAGAENWNRDVIRPLGMPLAPEGGTVILTGNLCPDGAVLKQSAASSHLLTHRGRAVVFEDHDDLHARIDDPSLPVDETSVLVLKRVGPKGAPGMPEWGAAPIPARLLKAGVKDMVRISDARMSGTSYGTVVLHVSPEAAVGGPLALVQDGDEIELDVPNRRLSLGFPTRSWPAAAPRGRRARRTTSAAMGGSSSTTCCRRTRARTSISCGARRRCGSRTAPGRATRKRAGGGPRLTGRKRRPSHATTHRTDRSSRPRPAPRPRTRRRAGARGG
jgi:dihydroxy-acid dehydratase